MKVAYRRPPRLTGSYHPRSPLLAASAKRDVWEGGMDHCITCLTCESVKRQHAKEKALVASHGVGAPALRYYWCRWPTAMESSTAADD